MPQSDPLSSTHIPVATYRLQLRNGVDFDRARALLPWLVELGVSHLYLAPPFHAASGSTHGYDVIDPTHTDPTLGGDDAFNALSDAARQAGLGIIVDIVPNHMAFTPENPWLADVMRHGQDSRYAPVFDIDWTKGRLHFPVLDGTAVQLLENGQITLAGSGEDPLLRVYEWDFPLRPTELAAYLCGAGRTLDAATLDTLLAEQHWSLGHWRDDADQIIHRRFFNITDLIGVRQEDPEVFALTHSWIIDQIAAGRIQGLRVDHIDGLARPGCYLHWLREAVGDTPVWIEKIVKPGEQIPASWPIEGMSGYEFMGPVTRLLTDPAGLAAMREASANAIPPSTSREVQQVRRELLSDVFTPELARVIDAARAALAIDDTDQPRVSSAIGQLAMVWPVYRSYAADLCPVPPTIIDALGDAAQDPACSALLDLLRAPDDPPARQFATRFEQLTGALTAKSEEDTVFFRSVAYLPLCEVGSEPDLDALDVPGFEAQMRARAAQTPLALNALSTHDTKRSADARAVLIALSRFPDLARALYAKARQTASDAGLPERWGIYALQTALMLRHQPDGAERIADHIAKAMREAKDLSRHEAPDEGMEAAVTDCCLALSHALADGTMLSHEAAERLDREVAVVVLAQVALQLTAPGVPDIYQGTEGLAIALTDPDNRRAVDWDSFSSDRSESDLSSRKMALTRKLLAERRRNSDLFARGTYDLRRQGDTWTIERSWEGERFTWRISISSCPEADALQPDM